MKNILYMAIAAVLCVSISSCSKEDAGSKDQKTKDLLVGTWVSEYDNDLNVYIELELKSNGKGNIHVEYESDDYEYDDYEYYNDEYRLKWDYYTDGDEQILYIDSDALDGEVEFTIEKLTNRTLVIESDHVEFEFERD